MSQFTEKDAQLAINQFKRVILESQIKAQEEAYLKKQTKMLANLINHDERAQLANLICIWVKTFIHSQLYKDLTDMKPYRLFDSEQGIILYYGGCGDQPFNESYKPQSDKPQSIIYLNTVTKNLTYAMLSRGMSHGHRSLSNISEIMGDELNLNYLTAFWEYLNTGKFYHHIIENIPK